MIAGTSTGGRDLQTGQTGGDALTVVGKICEPSMLDSPTVDFFAAFRWIDI